MKRTCLTIFITIGLLISAMGTDYHVGPGQPLANISEVPWDALSAGDRIYIHWRETPYYEKWVINAQGTASDRIEIIGVSGPEGQKPIIDGNGAVTPTYLDYWNEVRGLIKIGGSSVPADGLPSYITIENLELRSARPAYNFTNDNGQTETYSNNAASIYIEKGEHIIIRDCTIYDSGNGIFIGAFNGQTQDILISKNYIYDNGIVDRFFEHNTYTEALGIVYEYNRFGPLRSGALGNNLKDRSAGLVVRYNWIESGNRQLDLVDAGTPELYNDVTYDSTYVYGNILIEPDGAGNSQILHYGGDSGTTSRYRKGNLYFYNNTVISTRNSNTTLARLSTQDETMEAFNNVIYTPNSGSLFAMINDAGTLNLNHNWIKEGWVDSHNGSPTGTVNDQSNNIEGLDPSFVDFDNQDFTLLASSALIDAGMAIPNIHLPHHDVTNEYVKHTDGIVKTVVGDIDIGSFEYENSLAVDPLNPLQAKLIDQEVWLSWGITNEQNRDYFSIYKSANGMEWTQIGEIDGKNSIHQGNFYRFKDSETSNGLSYYQVYEHDINGFKSILGIVSINVTLDKNIKIYPNPNAGYVIVDHDLSPNDIYRIELMTLKGKILRSFNPRQLNLDLADLSNGSYILRVVGKNSILLNELIVLNR